MLFASRRRAKTTAVVLTLAATPALAENPAPAPQASADAGTTSITLDTIEIISQELNAARLQIQPSLGRQHLYFQSRSDRDHPAGRKRALEPGPAADAGRRAGQFRPNPGARNPLRQQHFATHRRPASAIWISDRRRSGHSNPRRASPIRASRSQCMAEALIGCSRASNMAVDWFLTGAYLGNDRGIENPAATFSAIHDATQQFHGFSYMSGIIAGLHRATLHSSRS
jgi:hypothetical protein